MPEIYDPSRALTEDWRTYFVERRHETFILQCVEGDVEIKGNWMLLNIMMIMPLIKRLRPISRDKHLMLSGIYTNKEHAKRLTEISLSLEEMGYTRDELGHDIITTVMDSHNMCYTHLGSFIRTMDIFSIADTILQPEVKPTVTMDYGDMEDLNIKRMENAFKSRSKEVLELLSGDQLSNNIFRSPLLCGSLKQDQFFQFILSAGPRTDTDDQMFLRPVVGSFLSGMQDIKDLAIESRSASKATHYNKTQMSVTQYQNRKLHIQNSSIWHLYPGDCGSTVFLTYEPNAKTVSKFIGKFYLRPNGDMVELTKERFDEVVNRSIKFRDVPGCKYADGYCEVCGGTITRSFSKTGNVGYLSNVNTGAQAAQQVLSTKHLISTNAAEYEVPHELSDFLYSVMNDIYLKPALKRKLGDIALGFQPRDISKLNDLKYVLDETQLRAAYYTDIKYMYLGRVHEDGTVARVISRIQMGSKNKKYPHLSPEVLSIIRSSPEDLTVQNGVVWFKLRNVDIDAPIMQCTVTNNSIKAFVNAFSTLVMKDVERYTSINDFMRDLSSLIYERVDPHITHLSCLARACLITSKKDFHIPVITDPDNVMFGTLGRIIPMRSIGGLLSFERFNLATNRPVSYITPKRHSISDEFMGFTDTIERDMNWPPGYDKVELI